MVERLDGLLNLALEFEGHLTPECMERGIETPIIVAPSPMHTEEPTKSTKGDSVFPGGTPMRNFHSLIKRKGYLMDGKIQVTPGYYGLAMCAVYSSLDDVPKSTKSFCARHSLIALC